MIKDWIGHFVGGVAMMICGILSIVYSIQVYYAWPCNKCNTNPLGLCSKGETYCINGRTKEYQPLLVLISGVRGKITTRICKP